jgi:hypothetical protein
MSKKNAGKKGSKGLFLEKERTKEEQRRDEARKLLKRIKDKKK